MPAPVNILKQRLARGEVLHGIWLGLAHAYAAEIAATADFDWLLIDGEHSPNDIPLMSAQIAVLDGKTPQPILRLPDDDPARIKQALDLGVQSLLIPMVDNAEQAAAIFRATRYPPLGMRGVGAGLARASRFGAITDYVATANDQICLIVQVESVLGLQALDQILAVPGLDGVFIGPSDLSVDMGLPASNHPEVRAAVTDAIRRIRAAGLSAGMLHTDPNFIRECRDAGANFVGVGLDVTTLANGLRDLARHWRDA